MIDREQKLGVVIPDGKHINPPIMSLLAERGLQFSLWANGRLHADVRGAPFTLTFQNHADVIGQVAKGVFAAGFVGSDRLAEYEASLDQGDHTRVEQVGRFALFSPTLRLTLLVRDNPVDNRRYQSVTDLRGARVVTTYPILTRNFLREYFPGQQPLPVEIDGEITGKEEGQVDAHKAAAAVVIVDSGGTMRTNFLRELVTTPIMTDIQPVLIVSPEYFEENRGKQRLLNQFIKRLQGNQRSVRRLPRLPGLTQFSLPFDNRAEDPLAAAVA